MAGKPRAPRVPLTAEQHAAANARLKADASAVAGAFLGPALQSLGKYAEATRSTNVVSAALTAPLTKGIINQLCSHLADLGVGLDADAEETERRARGDGSK